MFRRLLILCAALASAACAPSLVQRQQAAEGTLAALREARFDDVTVQSKGVLEKDAENPYARVAQAVVRYRAATHQLATDVPTIVLGAVQTRGFNAKYLRAALESFEQELSLVEADLAVAAKVPELALDLCLACWEVDWDRDGQVGEDDRRLLEIELDERGEPLPEGDPRRRPTYRYDHGDVQWARAFVSFQRAAADVLLAYRWSELDKLLPAIFLGADPVITLQLEQPARISEARARILAGLDLADAARKAYLAETDDEREWVPNPRQKNHPMPLKVDEALYQTWEQVAGDLRRIVEGKEALKVADLLAMAEPDDGEALPEGYLDLGGMLARPKAIVLDLGQLKADFEDERSEPLLEHFFGEFYVKQASPSPLPGRLKRMKGEIDREEESFERKLRYLLWLN